jgi:CelD/BcsL family acetyltransferase involved in cellulose biosynthesis
LHVEVISEPARLNDFSDEWRAFVRMQPNVTPFQTPEWLLIWWSHFGSGSLCVYVFRDPYCVGVVPCFVHQWNAARQVTLLGSGISDYLDPVLAPGFQTKVIAELGQQLQSRTDWDVCNWQDLTRQSTLHPCARVPARMP